MKRLFSGLWMFIKAVFLAEAAITLFLLFCAWAEITRGGDFLGFTIEQYFHAWVVLSIINPVFWIVLGIYTLLSGKSGMDE